MRDFHDSSPRSKCRIGHVWAGLATMPGLPATAIPAGRPSDGLPVGVQLIGPLFEDRTPLRLAELLEQNIGGFRIPPWRHAN